MFIAVDDGFVINLRDFDTMGLRQIKKTKKVKISGGFLGLFPKYEDKEDKSAERWALDIKYTKPDGHATTYSVECSDRAELVKSARKVFKQIQAYDPSVINAAFEEAFFKETP
jgi:hypothetical protein